MEAITEILCTVTGTIVGCVVGYCIFLLKHKNNYSAQLFNEYKVMAQELATILEDLLTLSIGPKNYTIDTCKEIDNLLSKYVFKYYLVLPQNVLMEINCLHLCLNCRGKHLFMIDHSGKSPIIRQCNTVEEINNLFTDVALQKTKGLNHIYNYYHRIPSHLNLKCQARHVITVMHNEWDSVEFYKWQKILPKHTIYQIEKE